MSVKYDEKVCFDSIPVGKDAIQSFSIENGDKHTNWTVTQYPGFNTALNAFTLKKKITKYLKNDKHEILIQYKPVQPNQTNVNYYLIKDISDKDIVLCVTGYSTGLSIQSSVKYINFYRLKNDFKTKVIFELRNNSACNVKFQFDIDNNQKIFEIQPNLGEIRSGKCEYITAQFITEKIGLFFMDLACLFHNHQPIYIELSGINSPKTEKYLKHKKGQCLKITLENGFEKYMNESFGLCNNEPMCSIKPKHLDFSLNKLQTNLLPEMLNSTQDCLHILWDTESEKDFFVNPQQFCVSPTQRLNFEVIFQPQNLEKFFGSQLYGRLFIFGNKKVQEDPDTVILPISIRVIGNSFMKTNNWTPSVKIYPETVLMPTCIQNKSVYSTFFIKRSGNYPVTFKIKPPKKSNFRVNPMVGLISNEFQLFVVKFSSANTKNGYFNEKWTIELNHKESVCLEIFFKANVEELKLLIGEKDQIDFGTVFPGCKKYLTVPLANKTQNTIKFQFQINKWFGVKPQEGVIEPFSCIDLTWSYLASCDVEEKYEFLYEMRVIQETKVVLGAPFIGSFEILAKCAHGKLCSSPTSFDFETVICGEPTSTSFTLYNFSEVTLHFLLQISEHFGSTEEKPVSLDPSKGSLAPGEHLEVHVNVLTYWSCLRTYCFRYLLRESEHSDILLDLKDKTFTTTGNIFRLDFYSFYPTLKFQEIAVNTTGPLFGKLNVWEYFQAEGFNETLRTIRMNETKKYSVRIPDAEAELGIEKSIIFVLRNVTREDTTCRFERKKICDCELKEVKSKTRIGSIRKFSYDDCLHRKLITITTSEEVVKAYDNIFVTIEIRYVLSGQQESCFLMHLSHNRTVEVYFVVIGLRSAQLSTYSNGFNLRMNNSFIGELNPDLQIFWFLNNTKSAAHFELDLGPLRALNQHWGHPIIACLNPIGFAEAKSTAKIKFLFAPVAAGKIHLELPFEFGSESTTLKIQGEAVSRFTSPLEQFYYTALGKETSRRIWSLFVSISTEHIVFRAIPTHCTTTRILTLTNMTSAETLGYTFDNYTLDGTLMTWIQPSEGLIAPGERKPLVLHVQTFGIACTLRITMICHLVNQTELKRHLQTTTEFYQQTDSRNDQFCIRDDGHTTYPPVSYIDITPAPKIFHRTLAITLHIIPQVDLDTKMTVQDQLKQTPFKEISIYRASNIHKFLIPRPTLFSDIPIQSKQAKKTTASKKCTQTCCVKFTEDEHVAIHTVLSCLLRDVITCNKFKHFVEVISDKNDRYYSEFKTQNMTVDEETTMTELIVNRISNLMLSELMQTLLVDCVFKQFNLGHFPHTCKKDDTLLKGATMSFGKLLYTEKFAFLLDNL